MEPPATTRTDVLAWGRAHRFSHQVQTPHFADEALDAVKQAHGTVLAHGLGRSYGDSALNAGQGLIDTTRLDRFVSLDRATGVLECEAGVSLAAILQLLEYGDEGPCWFLPVTPGTKFVTIGGAIANDVHGKNHHRTGCFGNHVLSLRLLRSDGAVLTCSPAENPDLFNATIGGLGLTGLILSARIALMRVPGLWLEAEDIRYDNLDRFYELSEESLAEWDYGVAWIDCLASGPTLGRGIFSRARHTAQRPDGADGTADTAPKLSLPIDLPGFALNRWSIGAFNALYWRKAPATPQRRITHYNPVFYPLDAIGRWNRLYGSRGFYQYQCAIPVGAAAEAVRALLGAIASAGEGSFLAVLKTFGDVPSPGLLSFPLPGVTLALDFPNRGPRTLALLERLDHITSAAGGRIYPAKDGRVSAADFQHGYPRWREFARWIDPHFSSSFWRRVSAAAA